MAHEAIDSGNFETLQFPFCYLATEKDLELVELCREHDMGFIAMKGLSGGLLNNAEACYAFMQAASQRGAHLGHPARVGAGPVAGADGAGIPA